MIELMATEGVEAFYLLNEQCKYRRAGGPLPEGATEVSRGEVLRDEVRRVEVQQGASVRGAPCLLSSLFKSLQRRCTMYITNLRHKPMLRWSDASLQGPVPYTSILALAPPPYCCGSSS